MTELEEKVLEACEYIENGDPLKDVLDDSEIVDAIILLSEYISAYYGE